MDTFAQRFKQHWREKNFPRQGIVLLALSGGRDSMVLAHVLRACAIPFAVAHCNFQLRGSESDADEVFVRDWCNTVGLCCHQIQFDTKKIAEQRREGIQAVARALRYEWFESLRREHAYAAILTAHHADDVAETLLINLCRGAGLNGLQGIPERNGYVLRPLLFASRREIDEYARIAGVPFREDASNAEDKYLRNAFRLRIIPQIEHLMPGAASRLVQAASRLRDASILYRKEMGRRLSRLMQRRGRDVYVPVRLLEKQEALLSVAFELFQPFGFHPDQTLQILALMHSESGRFIASASHRVIRHRDFLVITAAASEEAGLLMVQEVPAIIHASEGVYYFEWVPAPSNPSADANVALLDAASISFPLVLRPRREGDYFYPLGMGMKKKKLKRFLIDQKLALHEKECVRILESGGRIMWVAGLRIDERFKLKSATKRALRVRFQPNQK